jgi:hypothetical protein
MKIFNKIFRNKINTTASNANENNDYDEKYLKIYKSNSNSNTGQTTNKQLFNRNHSYFGSIRSKKTKFNKEYISPKEYEYEMNMRHKNLNSTLNAINFFSKIYPRKNQTEIQKEQLNKNNSETQSDTCIKNELNTTYITQYIFEQEPKDYYINYIESSDSSEYEDICTNNMVPYMNNNIESMNLESSNKTNIAAFEECAYNENNIDFNSMECKDICEKNDSSSNDSIENGPERKNQCAFIQTNMKMMFRETPLSLQEFDNLWEKSFLEVGDESDQSCSQKDDDENFKDNIQDERSSDGTSDILVLENFDEEHIDKDTKHINTKYINTKHIDKDTEHINTKHIDKDTEHIDTEHIDTDRSDGGNKKE